VDRSPVQLTDAVSPLGFRLKAPWVLELLCAICFFSFLKSFKELFMSLFEICVLALLALISLTLLEFRTVLNRQYLIAFASDLATLIKLQEEQIEQLKSNRSSS